MLYSSKTKNSIVVPPITLTPNVFAGMWANINAQLFTIEKPYAKNEKVYGLIYHKKKYNNK